MHPSTASLGLPAGPQLGRRAALAALGGAALARPALAQPAAAARALRFVPHANLANLDPVWSTQVISRIHGFLVYDTLYGTDADFRAHPQMAEGHAFEEGGTVCTVWLRAGLRFHDGEPVRARLRRQPAALDEAEPDRADPRGAPRRAGGA
jgi:peptide/nickel transport system substrate-binding protein